MTVTRGQEFPGLQDVAQAGRAEVSFTVPQDDLADTLTAAEQAVAELGAGRVQHGTNVSKLSVVGLGMGTHTGVAAQMFQSLADAGVNIGMITTSEIKISTLVSRCPRSQNTFLFSSFPSWSASSRITIRSCFDRS